MKKLAILFLCLCFCISLYAQQPEQMKLWPGEADNDAELFVYHPSGSAEKHPGVVICPGGAYVNIAIQHEGHDMAKWFASQGFVAVVLKYRLPKGEHTIPLKDAEKAISTLRSKAGEWNVDRRRTGVVGSSAGGHLAASLSTLALEANRPNFAILFYPVISFDNTITHPGSKQNLLGDKRTDPAYTERYSLEKQIDARTPPTLLLLSDDDKVVLPANSIRYYTALKERQIPASMFIYPTGGHGWGFNTTYIWHEEMKQAILKWLQEQKQLSN